MGKLENRVALITGATSGIGKATAILFAQEGARVVITGRRRDRGEQAASVISALGGTCWFIQADHTDAGACSRVVERTLAEFGRLDILFNNAGIVTKGTAETVSEEDWQATLAINVTAVWRMSRLVIPIMRRQGGGVIVNNASDWAVVGAKDALPYAVSKGAVAQMTKSMALDHAHENIRVNAVCPGDTFVERWEEKAISRSPARLRGSRPWLSRLRTFRCAGLPSPKRSPAWPCSWRATIRPSSPVISCWQTGAIPRSSALPSDPAECRAARFRLPPAPGG
ncbi:MAG: SDR family NAD(P)-dependent oxidoreductase [Candidatus Villigracilaceae bacterium]